MLYKVLLEDKMNLSLGFVFFSANVYELLLLF